MNYYKGKAIVLKEIDVGESDKIITILMKEKGKLSVSAKGARKTKSKFLAGTQLFTYSDFIIKDMGRFLVLSQVDVIESFYNIRNDYDKFCFAAYFLELTDKATFESMDCDDNLYLLIKSLQALSKNAIDPQLVACIFQIKFLQINGYEPLTESCCYCNNSVDLGLFGCHGVICTACKSNDNNYLKVSHDTIYTVKYILESDIKGLYSFKVSAPILKQLKELAKILMEYHFDFYLKSKEFFHDD